MKKINTIIAISILSLLAISITIVFTKLMKGEYDFNMFKLDSKMEKIDEIEKNIDEVKNINLYLLSTDVIIKESEKVSVEYFSNQKDNAKIEYNDNTISINEEELNNICVGICNVRRKVVVYLPKTYTGKLLIDTKSGDIESLIDLKNVEINTASADVDLKDIENASIRTMSGDVSTEKVNDLVVSTASGDVDVKEITNKVDIKTVSGDISIYKLEIKENSSLKTTSGDVVVHSNNSNCYVETNTTSGDVRVKKSDRKSDLELIINTTSGDIRVN